LNLGILLLNSNAQPALSEVFGTQEISDMQALAVRWLRKAQAANNPEAADILRTIYAQAPPLGGGHDPWQLPEDSALLQRMEHFPKRGDMFEQLGTMEEKDDDAVSDPSNATPRSQT